MEKKKSRKKQLKENNLGNTSFSHLQIEFSEKKIEKKLSRKHLFQNKINTIKISNFISIINIIKNQIITFQKDIIEYIILGIPFILMDYFIRAESKKINFDVTQIYSYIFSYIFIIFFIFSSKCLKRNIGRIYYSILFILHFLLFLTNIIFFSFTETFFQFKLLSYASEGSHYMIDVIFSMKIKIWINSLIIIISFIFALFKFRNSKKNNFPFLFRCFLIFLLSQEIALKLFGPIQKKSWDDFNKPANIFVEFSNPNKCMKITGFYKYIQRDFFKTYLNFNIFVGAEEKEELEFLKNIYKDTKMHAENEYTGIFKDKNIIFVQLEGMDTWILNENNTPTLHSLKNNSFVFTNHYSYRMNAGQTFNSEFCVNTGFYTPFSIMENSYDLYKNTFNSLPKMFKKQGYALKAFHFNYPEFYNRDVNYLGWGYDKFLSLIKTNHYKDYALAGLDTELIKNKVFYDEIFNTNGNFLYYFITYSVHVPFYDNPNVHTHYILQKKFGNTIPKNLQEDEIVIINAGETDEMVKLLIEGLKKHNLYNNTIIVFYADHCTNFNFELLSKHKITYDHRINHTPFFIWSANMEGKIINKTNAQLDILPTVLNLFGIPFQENSMIGRDIFDKNNEGIAFFEDYAWIDGKILINNGKITKLQNISENEINQNYISNKTQEVIERFKQNDLTLKYDYLKLLTEK